MFVLLHKTNINSVSS